MPGVNETSLARYADAIVRDGLLIGPGDTLAVHPEPIQRELAVALTEAGYRAGARYVDVLETDPRVTRARALAAPEDTLDWRPAWEDARMRELVREGAGIVWIAGSEDPQALRRRAAGARGAPRDRSPGSPGLPPRRRPRRRALRRRGVADARLGRPGLPRARRSDAGVAALGNDLLRFARLGADDPADGWRRARRAPRRSAPRGSARSICARCG